MNYIVRLAEKNESEFLAKERIKFLRSLGYEIKEDEYDKVLSDLTEQIKRKLGSSLVCVIAEYENTVIGTAYMTIDEVLYHPSTPKGYTANIVNVYTDNDYRGNGIATAMMKRLIDYGKENGIEKLTLDATDIGQPIYRKLGFVSEVDPILPTPMYLNLI